MKKIKTKKYNKLMKILCKWKDKQKHNKKLIEFFISEWIVIANI